MLDLTGKKFGRLTAVKIVGSKHKSKLWLCICDCGNETTRTSANLKHEKTKSCGCIVTEQSKINAKKAYTKATKHGMYTTKFYKVWTAMKQRCFNEKDINYSNYGARGITVCDEWIDFISFKNDMYDDYLKHIKEHGGRNTTLERLDFNGNYHKGNCKWDTYIEQQNNKRGVRKYEYKSKLYSAAEISRLTGINKSTFVDRVKKGLSVTEAIEKPISNTRNKKAENLSFRRV